MSKERDFKVRPGRIRSRAGQRTRPFIAQALAATAQAGGHHRRGGGFGPSRVSNFGRGRAASVIANRIITRRSRGAMIKARVVRHGRTGAPLSRHLDYLRREGVTRDGEKARMFGPDTEDADAGDFAERCEDDRHHFRFIVSPDDVFELDDLKSFTRDLMDQMQKDMGTELDWIATDHWNTEHPHIHVLVRGVTDTGEDLVISRDYIRSGMRDRASDLLTLELGPRTDLDIRAGLERQIGAERWTQLDRQLVRDGGENRIVDLAPKPGAQPDTYHAVKVGRLRTLERLGLAHPVGGQQWRIAEDAESTLRELGERNDIIKRIHKALTDRGIERAMSDYAVVSGTGDSPIIGRLVDRGLHDELYGTAYAVIDSIDGRTHHIKFHDLSATGDSAPGSIVELRTYTDSRDNVRTALAVRSDLSIADQIKSDGATWLDRQLVAGNPAGLSGGFGAEVNQALEARTDHLIEEGLARREGQRIVFARNLLATLRRRELDALGERLAAETGNPFQKAESGEYVAGTYRQRFALASGRFAMIDDGLGFKLVPWTPSVEQHLGKHVSGVARADGGVDWNFGRKRSLGL
ncbi:relaxase/mobilization nuclease domain-containing protein [Pelagibacterium luteolum]|uniref:Type IV secretory pathway, VirD2 components (Relaxase) n=1 Tax=Pelagibacterium luteolum TaxID=440168 RepID=A0A1G7YIZ7_9HYPH|nr:VirD2 family relaxase/mobilization nuclease [Pelagibacterium luteolum]SDG96453.1 Type IV secretory pathway, VirD2 components (relaxase) [Pelagibacterium luteolum]